MNILKNINLWFLSATLSVLPGLTLAQDSPPTDLLTNDVQSFLVQKFHAGNYSKKGADECLQCHKKDDNVMKIFSTPHGDASNSKSPMGKLQCESCHGPKGNHDGEAGNDVMIAFGEKANVSAELQDSVCMSCHDDKTRSEWSGSMHNQEEVACSNCHNIHAESDPVLSKSTETEVCTSCHTNRTMDTYKRSSHPVSALQI